jgi:hypothetical protein
MFILILEKRNFLSDKIPNVEFYIYQSGNIRNADKQQVIYCPIVIAYILKNSVFQNEVNLLFQRLMALKR